MNVAVLSDIHGNDLALAAVLADLETRGGADLIVVAGDLCLDGPRPREVIERLRALGCPVVQGNTDRDLVAFVPGPDDDEEGQLLAWTREQIGPDGLQYLASLPFSHAVSDPTGAKSLLVVHANPRDLDTHLRPLAPEATIAPLLAGLPPEVTTVAFGHLHIPYTRRVGKILLADISSVGLPKDGDRRAGYGLFTWGEAGWQVEQRRVEYPVDEVVAQLRAADPPGVAELVRKLLRARYPNMAAARGGRQPTPRPAARAAEIAPPPVAPVAKPRAARPARPAGKPAPPAPPVAPTMVAMPEPVAPAIVAVSEPVVAATPAPSPEVVPPPEPPPVPVAAPESERAAQAEPAKARQLPKGAPELEFSAGDSFPAILPKLLAERLDAVVEPLETVREDEDPEGVHDMRVAIRRLRGALEPAAPFYGAKGFKRAERRAKKLARALGTVRDADVHLASLRKRLKKVAPEERAGLASFIDAIAAERGEARADLDPVLDGWDGHHAPHLAELRAFFTKAQPRKGKGSDRDRVAAVAQRALTARLRALEALVPALDADEHGNGEELHEVRIAAKQVRYVLELFSPVLDPEVGELLEELKALQDLLGELHDRDVLLELLHEERITAAERELMALERAVIEEGPRAERLASVRAQLAAADGFAATAPGAYGLMVDLLTEREELETTARARWAALSAERFLERLWGLGEGLQRALAAVDAPSGTAAGNGEDA